MSEISKSIDRAIQLLQNAGLVAKHGEEEFRIRGGIKELKDEIITLLTYGFSISFENDIWLVVVPHKGQIDLEKQFENIDDAVHFVIEYYSNELPKYIN